MITLKALLAIGLVLNLAIDLKAQEISLGVSAGLVAGNANVANKIEKYYDYRVFYPTYGFNINGLIEYKISETIGIAAEPGLIRKGGIVRFGINHYTSVINMKLYYLQLPLLANFYFTDRFFVTAGTEFAYMINKDENLPLAGTGFVNFKENAFELSGLLGLNYNISKKLGLGLRYNHGLTKISILKWTDGYGPVVGESKVYNQYFQFVFRFFIRPR